MRLIFLHGINQQNEVAKALRDIWIDDLEKGIGRAGALSDVEVVMPFFGRELAELDPRKPEAIAQGMGAGETRELARFLAEGLTEQAHAAKISESEIVAAQMDDAIAAEGTAVPQSFPMDRRINALVSLLEGISPFHGDLALRLLGQAFAYLKKPLVRSAVDKIVRPAFDDQTTILVSHSLGTVIGYMALRERERKSLKTDVPLFVTMGSPLGLQTVQREIDSPFSNPAGVGKWINLRDPDDFVSLNRNLAPPLFGGPIVNDATLKNPGRNPHAIPGYLSHIETAKAISEALGL